MKCPVCGATTQRIGAAEIAEDPFQELGVRICSAGHESFTREVPLNYLANGRELASAQRRIERRIALYARDERIAADKRPAAIVAENYNLTPARVRQIRMQAQLRKKALS